MAAIRTPSRPAFDYKAPYATALRMALVVAVSATTLLSLASGHEASGAASDAVHVTLPRVEIVAHRESITPVGTSVESTTTVASEATSFKMLQGAANRGNLTQ